MRILLTGGTGYVGSHTAVALIAAGHQVVLYDNLSKSSPETPTWIEQIVGGPVPFLQGDVRDVVRLEKGITEHRIEAVVHCAGFKSVGESVHQPIEYYANNVHGAIALLQAMDRTGLRRLVFSSSASVYGVPAYLPIDEDHPTSPTNPYGRGKLQIEEMLRDVANSDPCWRILCLRYFNPVGAHDSGTIGDRPTGSPSNLMPAMAMAAAGKSELTIHGGDYPTPDGTGIRDYVHVVDLAQGHAAGIAFLDSRQGWHAVNLGTGRGHSVLEVVSAFEQASGRPVPYTIRERRTGDVDCCYADVKKAARELRWVAHRSLTEMCASTWRFHGNVARRGTA